MYLGVSDQLMKGQSDFQFLILVFHPELENRVKVVYSHLLL